MNTFSYLYRIVIPILIIQLCSCKKEKDPSLKTSEELLRILKVERIDQNFKGHPFYNYPGAVVYEYDKNSNLINIDIKCYAESGINCDDIIENTIVNYSVGKSGNQYTFVMSDKTRSYNYFYLDTLRVLLSNGFISSAEQMWAPRLKTMSIPIGHYKTLANVLSAGDKLKSGEIMRASFQLIDSDEIISFPLDSFSLMYKVEEYTNKSIGIKRKFIDPDLAMVYYGFGEYDFLEEYELVPASPDLPPSLVRMVNNALISFVPLGLETSPISVTREIGGFLFAGIFPAPLNQSIFQDWIFKLGMLDLDLLKNDGHYIINSKKITGRKVVGVTGSWPDLLLPTYQTIDSTATFPYTHDPVAKTLEIAGLKIWYEVVE